MDEKSSQTNEMAIKISEKRSELVSERAFMPTKRSRTLVSRARCSGGEERLARETRRTYNYAAEWPMYNGTVLCRLFESQNVPKSCSLLPNVGSAEHRKIEF